MPLSSSLSQARASFAGTTRYVSAALPLRNGFERTLVRHDLVDATRRMRRDSDEYVPQIRVRLDSVGFAGSDEGVEAGRCCRQLPRGQRTGSYCQTDFDWSMSAKDALRGARMQSRERH
jgi:hypothetical protein